MQRHSKCRVELLLKNRACRKALLTHRMQKCGSGDEETINVIFGLRGLITWAVKSLAAELVKHSKDKEVEMKTAKQQFWAPCKNDKNKSLKIGTIPWWCLCRFNGLINLEASNVYLEIISAPHWWAVTRTKPLISGLPLVGRAVWSYQALSSLCSEGTTFLKIW